MSFAHDIVMCSDPPVSTTSVLATGTTATITTTMNTNSNKTVTVSKVPNGTTAPKTSATLIKNASVPNPESGAINSMLSQLHGTSSLPASTAGQHPITGTTPGIDYKDPLRELVLISEAICIDDKDTTYLSNVKILAKEATVLEHIKEVLPEQAGLMPLSPAPLGGQHTPSASIAGKTAASEVSTTLNLFQDPKDMVDPIKEREFLKKLEALDDDSEGFDGIYIIITFSNQFFVFYFLFIDKPVLGKISLIRRAKSAVARSASAKRTNDKHPLFHVAWDEHIGIANDGFVFDEAAQTPNADDVVHPVTVEEAKRTMEQFHMRKCTPPLSAKVMDEKTGKYMKTRRVKTAKNK